MMFSSSEEIVRELRSQGVVACKNISVKSEGGERRNTSTFILTFHTTTVPKHIYVAVSGVVERERGGTPFPQVFFGGNAVPPNDIRTRGTVIQ